MDRGLIKSRRLSATDLKIAFIVIVEPVLLRSGETGGRVITIMMQYTAWSGWRARNNTQRPTITDIKKDKDRLRHVWPIYIRDSISCCYLRVLVTSWRNIENRKKKNVARHGARVEQKGRVRSKNGCSRRSSVLRTASWRPKRSIANRCPWKILPIPRLLRVAMTPIVQLIDPISRENKVRGITRCNFAVYLCRERKIQKRKKKREKREREGEKVRRNDITVPGVDVSGGAW